MKISTTLLLALFSYILGASGFASRYWDCCKPSCSWAENAGGNPARQCDASMNPITDASAKSMCEGGPSTTCLDQIPIVVNDNLAYAFGVLLELLLEVALMFAENVSNLLSLVKENMKLN